MIPPARSTHRWFPVLLALGLPLACGLLLGGDSSWDLRNYHLYDVHAWWTGRALVDIAPAQLQSWYNPLLDLPLYLLVRAGAGPRLLTLWLVVPAIVSLWAILRLHARLSPTPPGWLPQLVLSLLVLGGAAFGSTLGLSSNDGFVAAGMLAALAIAVGGEARAAPRGLACWLAAGVLAGATAGLKLSAAFYCIALAAAALPGGTALDKLRRLGMLAAGGVLGFLLTEGWWALHLQSRFGNPLFPYFNQVFLSPWAMPYDWVDPRFKPTSLLDAATTPFRLLADTQHYSELKLRDPRLLLSLLCFPWLAFRSSRTHDTWRADAHARLAAFAWVGAAAWLWQSGIYRYAIALEALGALALVLLVQQARGRYIVVAAALVLVVAADTRRPHWGRDAGAQPLASMAAPDLGPHALVLIATGEPLAYLALALPDSTPVVGVSNNLMAPQHCTTLQAAASTRIAAHAGPLWVLETDSAENARARQLLGARYGLVPTGECRPIVNPLAPARACALRREGPARAPCLRGG
jgi:hypothetical protein